MKRSLYVEMDDESWPELWMRITSHPYPEIVRQIPYDIAYPSFEVHVQNVLRSAVTDIISARRASHGESRERGQDPADDGRVQTRDAPQRIEKRTKSQKPKTSRGDRIGIRKTPKKEKVAGRKR